MDDKQLHAELKALRLELRSTVEKLRGIMDRASAAELSVAKARSYSPRTKMGPSDPKIKHTMRRFTQHIGLSLNEANMAIARASSMMVDSAELPIEKNRMDLSSSWFDGDAVFDENDVFDETPDLLFKQALIALQSNAGRELYRGVEVCPGCNKAITLEYYSALSFEWSAGFQHVLIEHDVKAPASFYRAVMDNFIKEFKPK